MNNSNPFVPQGSLLEQQSKRRSHMKLGVFCVLAVGVTSLMAMLIQGCKREPAENTADNTPPVTATNEVDTANTNPPPMDFSNAAPVAPTNPPIVAVAPPVEPAAGAEHGAEHVVVKGDTFGKLAKQYGVTIKAISAANPGVDSSKLKLGQKLVIPAAAAGAAAPMAAATTSGTSTGAGSESYVVKSGDTLTKIAKAHGVTVKAIESANNLSTTKIKVGQKLKLPAKAEAAAAAPAPEPMAAPAPVAPVTSPAPAR